MRVHTHTYTHSEELVVFFPSITHVAEEQTSVRAREGSWSRGVRGVAACHHEDMNLFEQKHREGDLLNPWIDVGVESRSD